MGAEQEKIVRRPYYKLGVARLIRKPQNYNHLAYYKWHETEVTELSLYAIVDNAQLSKVLPSQCDNSLRGQPVTGVSSGRDIPFLDASFFTRYGLVSCPVPQIRPTTWALLCWHDTQFWAAR